VGRAYVDRRGSEQRKKAAFTSHGEAPKAQQGGPKKRKKEGIPRKLCAHQNFWRKQEKKLPAPRRKRKKARRFKRVKKNQNNGSAVISVQGRQKGNKTPNEEEEKLGENKGNPKSGGNVPRPSLQLQGMPTMKKRGGAPETRGQLHRWPRKAIPAENPSAGWVGRLIGEQRGGARGKREKGETKK